MALRWTEFVQLEKDNCGAPTRLLYSDTVSPVIQYHQTHYQSIIERSRLVEQLAHHRLYDTKHYSSTLIIEKDSK